jgi:ribonuclease HII
MFDIKCIPEFPCEIIATDEVGRGPLGGPVVVGAVRIMALDKESMAAFLKGLRLKGVKDSKKITPSDRLKILKKIGLNQRPFREKFAIEFKGITLSYITWDMDHEIIDQENILGASLRGMKEASLHLSDPEKLKTVVLIDGPHKLRWGKDLSFWHEVPVVKGDSKSVLIGLASLIAKEKRDHFMRDMHELYPQYGFNTHFGYPTKAHKAAIQKFGPCPIHRKTFQGVKEYIRT